MATTQKFTIKRITPEKNEPPKNKPKKSKPPKPKKAPPQNQSSSTAGGYFKNVNALLAFLGSALKTEFLDQAIVRRSKKQEWWVEAEVPFQSVSPLIQTTGGKAYARQNNDWIALTISGELPEKDRQNLNVSSWEIVDFKDLLATANLPQSTYSGSKYLNVLVPGALGRWILRRAIALGLHVQIIPVIQSPLGTDTKKKTHAILLCMSAPLKQEHISPAFVHSLIRLPYVIVSDATHTQNLLIDVRCRCPLPVNAINHMVPKDETWLLSPGETGNWLLKHDGKPVDGFGLLDTPKVNVNDSVASGPKQMPKKIPVRLIHKKGLRQTPDAILLDHTELKWMSSYLRTRPLGETSFITAGPDVYLLTAPTGLTTNIPFGIPLIHVGSEGLYVEMGIDFYPLLPDSARQKCFQLKSETVVVMLKNASYRFNLKNTTPAWTFWVGNIPEVEESISPKSQKILSKISKFIKKIEASQMQPKGEKSVKPISKKERSRLIEKANKAELSGNFILAAELLEKAGYHGQAGRLYEKAAMQR